MVQNAMVKPDFRATATHFMNIFVFLSFFDFFYGFGGVQWAVIFPGKPARSAPQGLQKIAAYEKMQTNGRWTKFRTT